MTTDEYLSEREHLHIFWLEADHRRMEAARSALDWYAPDDHYKPPATAWGSSRRGKSPKQYRLRGILTKGA